MNGFNNDSKVFTIERRYILYDVIVVFEMNKTSLNEDEFLKTGVFCFHT